MDDNGQPKFTSYSVSVNGQPYPSSMFVRQPLDTKYIYTSGGGHAPEIRATVNGIDFVPLTEFEEAKAEIAKLKEQLLRGIHSTTLANILQEHKNNERDLKKQVERLAGNVASLQQTIDDVYERVSDRWRE